MGVGAEASKKRSFEFGPGLAIRIPVAVTRDQADILRKANAVYPDAIRKPGLYHTIWQAFAVLLPVKTVGVMGGARSYDQVCALRAVTSTDEMMTEATAAHCTNACGMAPRKHEQDRNAPTAIGANPASEVSETCGMNVLSSEGGVFTFLVGELNKGSQDLRSLCQDPEAFVRCSLEH